jgi:hypothetical protein
MQVKARLVELGAVIAVVSQAGLGDIEVKRATGYFLALIAENAEFHHVRDISSPYMSSPFFSFQSLLSRYAPIWVCWLCDSHLCIFWSFQPSMHWGGLGDIEVKRATGYFLALIAENAEFHHVRELWFYVSMILSRPSASLYPLLFGLVWSSFSCPWQSPARSDFISWLRCAPWVCLLEAMIYKLIFVVT